MRGMTTAMSVRSVIRWRPLVMRIVVAAAVAATAACHRFRPQSFVGAPEGLYAASVREFRQGRFQRALDGLTRLAFDLSPRDTLLPRARYYQAEARYGLNDFVLAARDFRRVADDFPGDVLAPTALLRAGDSYARLWRAIALDPSQAQTALTTYQEVATRWPDTPAGRLAGVRIRGLQDQLARKDFEAGLFYFKRGGYDSAILYFRAVIAAYPSSSVVPEAFVKLVEAYSAIRYTEERDETCQHLRQYYPARPDVRQVCGNGNPGR